MKNLGKFEILEKVGEGGMGVVYKAHDPMIGRTIALKTLTTALSEDPNLLKRFYSEAKAAGGLQHPNIVTIYELGHEGSTPFIAMQFLSGESLDRLIARRLKVPLSQKIGFIVYVCRALDYAHKQDPPVIHRDIKPANVMVTAEGTVMVVDFGIARLGEGTRSQSGGTLTGTLAYMAPQLFRGDSAEARSDIWSTGVMFYELLAYRRPFEGNTAAALISNIMMEKPEALSKMAPGTPADVESIVNRMLCKETDGRFQSMEEVLLQLEPVWRRLQRTDVSSLVASGWQLLEAGDFTGAQEDLRRALQIDTSNAQAKTLLEKVKSEIRRNKVIPQLQARVEKARNHLSAGQLEDALAEAEAILRVDSTFPAGRELLEQAQAAVDRAHSITEALRGARKLLTEGALTEAEIQLDRVLEIEPGNASALELYKQIRTEIARRELMKRRDETVHRARTLWTNLQYEECIALLISAQERFPGDPEIINLLETARRDQAEQHKQRLLAEIRNLISAQQFEPALGAIEKVVQHYPADSAAADLKKHVLQGKERQDRERRLKQEKSTLQTLLKAGNYQEVIVRVDQLAQEFSDDFELNELLHFARTERLRAEREQKLERWREQVQRALDDGRYPDAIQEAHRALAEFSQNADILVLLERAKKEQSENEKDELLRQRLRELEKMIERQDLTDAIDLAQQTLTTIGPHSGITNILHDAKREYEFREIKRQKQDVTFQEARTLIDGNNLKGASELLTNSVAMQLLTLADQRVQSLFQEIEAKEKTRRAPESITSPPAVANVTGPPAKAMRAGVSGTSYASPPQTAIQQQTAIPRISVLPGEETVVPTSPTRQTPLTGTNKYGEISPATDSRTTRNPAFEMPGSEVSPGTLDLPWRNTWKVMAGVVFALAVVALIFANRFLNKGENEAHSQAQTQVTSSQEVALQGESQDLRSQGKFDEADRKDQQIIALSGGLATWARQDMDAMRNVRQQESALMSDAKSAEQQKDYRRAEQAYRAVIDLRGPQQSSAQAALGSVEASLSGVAAESVAQASFDRGVQAFSQRDYRMAESILRDCLGRAPEAWPRRAEVQSYLTKSESRVSQLDALQRAQNEFASGQHEPAKTYATESANTPDGDSRTKSAALDLLRRIRGREEQRKLYEQAGGSESRGQLQQAKTLLDRVSSFPDGDTELAKRAATDVSRLSEAISSKNASLVREIDESIRQGQFDVADTKLKDLPSDQSDYARLKAAATAGRKEDAAFQAKEAELERAMAGRDEAALRALRDFFRPIARGTGRHSQQAGASLSEIDLDLNKITASIQPSVPPSTTPPTRAGPVASPVSPDQERINQLKADYKNGFQTKNILLLRHIWPSITDKKVKEYEDIFRSAESVKWNLNDCGAPVLLADTATLRCVQDIEITQHGEQPQHRKDSVTFFLQKQGSDWTIARVDAQRIKN